MVSKQMRKELIDIAKGAYETHQHHPSDVHFKWYWRGMEEVLNHILTVEEMKSIKGPVRFAREAGLNLVTREGE